MKKARVILSPPRIRYRDLGGQTSKRHLIKTLNKHFGDKIESTRSHLEGFSTKDPTFMFSGVSEYSLIHKIIDDIKNETDKIPPFTDFKCLDINIYKQYIPDSLTWIVTLLVSGKAEKINELKILSLCQDIIFFI